MYRTLILSLAALATLSAAQPAASQQREVIATVNQFVDSFNQGDIKALLAACAEQTSILDDFPPHEWHGAGACARWTSEFDADAKKNGITDGVVILSPPSHVDITADRAYVVAAAHYSFKRNGKPVSELASMTITLQNVQTVWRITGFSWAKQ